MEGVWCLVVCPLIPDIERSSHNPDITLSEIGFVLFGAKNTFASKKGGRGKRRRRRRRRRGGPGRRRKTDFARSSDCLGKRNAWLQSIE